MGIYKVTEATVVPKSAASSAIATDIVPLGYRVTVDEGVYVVRLPQGMKKPAVR